MDMRQFRERCQICGRYLKFEDGVSWSQSYTHLDLNDPTYRCKTCTEKYGVKTSNCADPERYSGIYKIQKDKQQ